MNELHIGNKNYSSWSLRPWVLMKTLQIPFTEQLHQLGLAPHVAGSPSGRVPFLKYDGLVIWDSLAIVEFLAERSPGVWPSDQKARAWARCAAAEMHSGFGALRSTCSMCVGLRMRLPEVSPALAADTARLEQLWAEGLSRHGGPFLGGASFTAVDAFFAPVAFRHQTWGFPLGEQASGYLARLRELPAMKAWERDALAEPWREGAHEEEIAAAGTILADLRLPPA